MAVTTQYSDEYTNIYKTSPPSVVGTNEWGGKLRVLEFTHTQNGAGDATSSITIGKLPPGKVTLLTGLSSAYVNWTTASATLDMGYAAYTKSDGTAVSASVNAIIDGLDVDTAGIKSLVSTTTTAAGIVEFDSRDGVDITVSSTDTAIADGDTIHGYLVYIEG